MTNDSFDALVLSRNYKAPIQDLATIESELATKGITNPRSQGCPRFQSGEELANSVGKINAC